MKGMKKCDFCTQSDQNGKCCWNLPSAREKYCKEAIKQMVKAIGKQNKDGAENG